MNIFEKIDYIITALHCIQLWMFPYRGEVVAQLLFLSAGDIGLPRPLNCGGAGNLLNTVVLWLSSGGTKSVLHYDDLENINCLLSGTKDLVLIDRVSVLIVHFNTLAPGRYRSNLKRVISEHLLRINIMSTSLEIPLGWMLQSAFDDKSTVVQVMAWCCQATSRYLNQCWSNTMLPYAISRPQWVNSSTQ